MVFKNSKANDGAELLKAIVGARLTSVQFVLDYLILGFDEKGALTTLVWPEVRDAGRKVTFGTAGYRDRLCELIEHIVTDVEVGQGETIMISFDDESRIQIPLRSYKQPGERAILTTSEHGLYVW